MTYKNPEQQRTYQRQWIQNRRDAWLQNKSCMLCGSIAELQIDHINPQKKVDHRIWSWSQAKRDLELSKCQVLCNPCHLKKSAIEKALGERHGLSKLTEQSVIQIRGDNKRHTTRQLATTYGVSVRTINDILSRTTWKHV